MDERFTNLKKIPKDPARRLLALANLKLETALDAPAAAPVGVVLSELAEKRAQPDMLRLLAVALPVREAIWWGCLAAGDLVAPDASPPGPLAAARAWVFKPTDENRQKARTALDAAESDDDTTLIATAVTMHDGKLAGSGDLAKFDAPAGGSAMAVLALNALSLGKVDAEGFAERMTLLIERGLDIARGGNGQFKKETPDAGASADAGDGAIGTAPR